MFVSDAPHGLDTDLFSWDGSALNNSELPASNIPPAHTAGNGTFATMNPLPPSGPKQPRTLAPNLTRRSHKKSRAGCYTCKHRKIKCGEQKPKCANCTLKSLDCVYPTVEPAHSSTATSTTSTKRSASTTSPTAIKDPHHPPISLITKHRSLPCTSPTASTFTMLDMRFFHHFLTTAYPHLPLGNDHVWVNEIPQFAERHCYLMHALLSLGASHLSRLTGVDYRKESLVHRGLAIKGLNEALSASAAGEGEGDSGRGGGRGGRGRSSSSRVYGDSDAMLAACYALTFQASYMGDGLADFITMVRGCALTTAKVKEEDWERGGVGMAFNLRGNWHLKIMEPRLASLPRVNEGLVEGGLRGLEAVRGLMPVGEGDWEEGQGQSVEGEFHRAITEVLEALRESSREGYLGFTGLYAVWYELPPAEFKQFLDPANLPAQLLLAYFVALQMLMVPLAVYEWPERADKAKSRVLSGTVEWATNIFKRLETAANTEGRDQHRAQELVKGLAWPKRIVRIVKREIGEDWTEGRGEWAGQWDEDMLAGVSVLKLGLPISPSVEADGSSGSEGEGFVGDIALGWDQGGGESGVLDRFWDDDPGMLVASDASMGGVNPVFVTSMGLDAGVAAQVPISLALAQNGHGGLDAIDMDMNLM